MKAKEYYAKYGPDLIKEWDSEPSSTEVLTKLVIDLHMEAVELDKLRNGKTRGALLSAIGEQNEKWNAIVRLFEKAGHVSPLKWNGFINAARIKFPDIFEAEITHEQILEAQLAAERVRAKEQFTKDMIAAAKKLQTVEQSVKEKERQVNERDLKNAKFV